MNLKFFHFFLIVIYNTLINSKIIKTLRYQKRIKNDTNYIESILNKNKQKLNTKLDTYVIISKVNNYNIIKANNNNILIPVSENIVNDYTYLFKLELSLQTIIFNDEQININYTNIYKQTNKVNLILLINREECYKSSFYIKNKEKRIIDCQYYSTITKECKIEIKLNNDIYNFNCFNNNTNVLFLPFKILDCIFQENLMQIICTIKQTEKEINIDTYKIVNILINDIKINYLYEKTNDNNFIFYIQNKTNNIIYNKGDKISIIFFKNYVLFQKDFYIHNSLNNLNIINHEEEKDNKSKQSINNTIKNLIYKKYNFNENPTYYIWNNIPFYNKEIIEEYNKTNISINSLNYNYDKYDDYDYYISSLYYYKYNGLNYSKNKDLEINNVNICDNYVYEFKKIIKNSFISTEYNEYYFTNNITKIKINLFNKKILDYIIKLFDCGYNIHIVSNNFFIKDYTLNYEQNNILLFIGINNKVLINEKNDIEIILKNEENYILIVKTVIIIVNFRIDIYDISVTDSFVSFNFRYYPFKYNNYNFQKIICIYNYSSYTEFFFNSTSNKYACLLDSKLLNNSKYIISFYSIFNNNNEQEVLFLKEILIESRTANLTKDLNILNDISYQPLLYNSSFYNKTIYEDDYIINYTLRVNYEQINGTNTYIEDIEGIKNDIDLFKLTYKLKNCEKYYINDFSKIDFYLINKPIINFYFEELAIQKNYFCLINNKYIIHSFYQKISHDSDVYEMRCHLNFPWLDQFLYPNKLKICIYNNITTLIPEQISLYDCKYVSFLDDSFFISNNDDILYDNINRIISFKSNKLINIFNIINSYGYNIQCLIKNETDNFTLLTDINPISNKCKCILNENINIEGEYQIYIIFKFQYVNDNHVKSLSIFIGSFYALHPSFFDYYTSYNNYIVINSQKEQNITLKTLPDYKFDINKKGYCLLKNNYFSYLFPGNIINNEEINCIIPNNFDIYSINDIYDIYYVYDYNIDKNNFLYYNKALNSPIKTFRLPLIRKQNIYIDFYEDYFYINISNFQDNLFINDNSYYILILNNTLFYDCYQESNVNINSYKKLKCLNNKNIYPFNYIYDENNNETNIYFIYDIYIDKINYLYFNIDINIFYLIPFSPLYIKRFEYYCLSSFDNNIYILFESRFTNIFYDYNPSSTKIYFFAISQNSVILDISLNKENNNFFKFILNANELIRDNQLINEVYYFIYYKTLEVEIYNKLPFTMLKKLYIINLSKIELINISPVKEYYNKNKITMKFKISNFIYKNNDEEKIHYNFILSNNNNPNYIYYSDIYKCEKSSIINDNEYNCLVQFKNDVLFYLGTYCIGITLFNSDMTKYFCNAENNINIKILRYYEKESSNIIYYNIISINPSIFIINTNITIIFNSPMRSSYLNIKDIYPIIDYNQVINNCEIFENILNCNISELLGIDIGYHTISITNNTQDKNIISNSLSFILIKKPEIISYEPKLIYPTRNKNVFNAKENNFIKITFESPILNEMEYLLINNITCRFKSFNLSQEIKMPFIQDTKGLIVDKKNIVCFLENNYFIGDYLYVELNIGDYNNNYFLDLYNPNIYFLSQKMINIINYEPKYIFIDINKYNNQYVHNNIIISTDLSKYINDNINIDINCFFKNNINDFYLISNDVIFDSNKIICSLSIQMINSLLLNAQNNNIEKEIYIDIIINEIIQNTNNYINVKILNNSNILYVYPREFSTKGKIYLNVIGNNFYNFIKYECNFFFDENKYFTKEALYVDNNLIKCPTQEVNWDLQSINDAKYIIGRLTVINKSTEKNIINNNNFEVKIYKDIILNHLSPNFIFLHNNYGITIYGENFINVKDLMAKITYQQYSILVKPIYIDSKTLFIYSPTSSDFIAVIEEQSQIPLELNLSISNNNYEYNSILKLFMYPYPIIYKIEPSYVYHQGEQIILNGYNFYNKLTHCLFIDEINNIEQISEISAVDIHDTNNNKIICDSPYFIPYFENNSKDIYVRIKLISKHDNIKEIFELQKIYLQIKKLIYIEQENIKPNKVIINNIQKINITLDNNNLIPKEVIESNDFKIKICEQEIHDIEYISYSSFSFNIQSNNNLEECILILLYKNKTINIQNNKIYFINYTFEELDINPTLADYKGGTLISIYNKQKYIDIFDYKCVFINKKNNNIFTYVKAYIINDNILTCMTEPHELGEYYFSILINDVISSYPTYKFNFKFYGQVRISNIHPLKIPKYYQCLINLETENVIYNQDLIFKIGKNNFISVKNNQIYKKDENDDNKFFFEIPKYLEEGNYSFSISNNNQNFYHSYYVIQIIDVDKIEISLSQYYIPFNTDGDVYVYGSNFDKYIDNKNNLKVKFGENNQQQNLIYVNNSCLSFKYPNSIISNRKNTLTFYFNEFLFKKYYPEIILYKNERDFAISPIYFFTYDLNKTVFVKSLNNDNDELIITSCLFNNTLKENAYYIEDKLFFCNVPNLPFGTYEISFSCNDKDYIMSTLPQYQKINIIKNFELLSIIPDIISNKYKSDIIIFGNNFINLKYKCKWINNKSLSDNIILTNGEYLDSHNIKCDKPNTLFFEFYNKNDYESIYSIEIGLDNNNEHINSIEHIRASFNYNNLLIYIYQYPPNGYFIDIKNNYEIKKCSKGYFCNRNNVSFKNIYKYPCYYGYYMIYEGRSLCMNCPKNGYDCSIKDIQNPIIDFSLKKCPQGFICTKYGIEHLLCPNGFICNPQYSINPIPCPVGYYCFEGTSSLISITDNYQTPQQCIIGHICPLKSQNPLGIGECLLGHYCPDDKSGPIPCPPRTYCPERGNIKPILCEEGFYNDKFGMERCFLCPIGFICPIKGLFKPIECPPGYYCDKEGLIYPNRFCRPGSICLSGVKFGFEDKICFYSRECDSLYYDQSPIEGNQYLENILKYDSDFHTVLCCYNPNKFYEMFEQVDKLFINSININLIYSIYYKDLEFYLKFYSILLKKYSFIKYYSAFQKKKLNGYNLAVNYIENKTIDYSLSLLNITIPFHKDILNLIISQMLNNESYFSPERCPRKYFCLEGVATLQEDRSWNYTPKICTKNFYCSGGDKYESGTARCPRDYFCPEGTDTPSFTSEGTIIYDNVLIETECYPGTFITSESGSKDCLDCPDGYDCSTKGTYWPTICKQGYYRTIYETCVPCPKGTFSFMRGIQDSSLCSSCPPGTVCQNTGINNLENIKICDEGYVCGAASGIYKRENCPKGFFCIEGTKPQNKYQNTCPEGYICAEGVGDSNRYGTICPSDYYCPFGSSYIVSEGKEETIIEYDSLPKCPFGTSSYDEGGLKNIIECKIKPEHHIFIDFEFDNLRKLTFDEKMKNKKHNKNKFNRNLDEVQDKDKDKEIEEQIDENIINYYNYYKDLDLIELFLSKYDSTIVFDYTLNTLRKPLISFSPINLTSSYTPYKSEEIIRTEFSNYFKIYKHYFKIEKNSYALITIDLRHIISLSNDIFFIYGIDWDITFEKVISLENDNYQMLDIPTTFLSKDNDKSKVHEFNIYSFEDMILSFNINIYNGIYFTYISYFIDIATLVNVYPERAELETNKFFGVFLFKEKIDTISFPVNIPLKNTSFNTVRNLDIKDKLVKNLISYNLYSNDKKNIKNVIREGLNNFPISEDYWDISSSLGMTHIPFISNCNGYGQYIHLWSLLEQNSQCELKPENETIFIRDFSFGVHAVGDNCNISLKCIYDENVGTLSNDKFWYQTDTGFSLFKISKNPITLDMLYNPDDLELVDVIVQNNLENDEIPKDITLTINYFQVSKTLKRIIDARLVFSNPWNKTQIQRVNDSINYTFNIVFNPYSHTDLMISFALSSNFYIVLYLVEGFATTVVVFIFFLFHRQISHIIPRPTFKIRTFFPLILPPVIIGFLLSIIPIFLEIIICHLFFVGKLIFENVKIFNMTNSKGEECVSIFDFIGYLEDSELSNIRKGRFGTAFLFLGIFLTYYHTQLVVPNVPIKAKRSFDNNRFDFINWKRLHVYYVDFLLSILNIYYTILSFCNLWSENIWYFIYSYKIIGIIAENYFEDIFQEQLLIAGFGCLFNLMQNMITFGASDLIDFLLSSMIEQISLVIEKVYIEAFTNYLKDHMDEYKKIVKEFIRKLLKYDVDLEFETKDYENIGEEEDDEAIILEEEKVSEISTKKDNPLRKSKTIKSEKKLDENDKNSSSDSSGKKEKKEGIVIEEYLDRYKGFASDLLSYFYNIFFYFILWITREENYILEYYDISNENFIYFYYFSLVNISFAIINDIIMHNLLEEYSNIQIHDFLDYFNYRYHIRTENWALDQQEINFELDPSSIKMFKIGFSSQYYYLKTIYVSGLLFIVIGAVTLILNEINPFLDMATPCIILFVYITLKIILTLSSFFIHIFKIWEVEKEQKPKTNKNEKLLNNTNNKYSISPHTIQEEKWGKIKFIKEQEHIIEENLKTERLILDITKKQFIAQNKQWLRNNIQKIITPRTLLQNKKKLIDVLGKKYSNVVKTNINVLPVKLYSPNNSSNENEEENDINSDSLSYKNRKKTFKQKAKKIKIINEILMIWRNRANLNKKLMKIVRLTIVEMKDKKCCICGLENDLNAFYEGNLVNTFVKYLKEKNKTMDNFNEIDFKIYFKNIEKNKVKTKCVSCS